MIIIPAIDIKEGKVVRLFQGQFHRVTEYSHDPLAMAQHWENQGAQLLHIVDLDGARTGDMSNVDVIKKIAKSIKIPIQVGGGIRSTERIDELITAGIKRVILGTKAIEDETLLCGALDKWQNHIAVSVDCAEGMLSQRGWVEVTKIRGTDFAKKLESLKPKGVKCIIYSDIQRDGTLGGLNFQDIEEILQAVKMHVIASGGISSLTDIHALCNLRNKYPLLVGAITGRAIYENKLDFKMAVQTTQNYQYSENIEI